MAIGSKNVYKIGANAGILVGRIQALKMIA